MKTVISIIFIIAVLYFLGKSMKEEKQARAYEIMQDHPNMDADEAYEAAENEIDLESGYTR